MTGNEQLVIQRSLARAELLQLSQDMLEQADAGHWDEALATQRVRRLKIMDYFDNDPGIEQPADLAVTIRTLLAIDAELSSKLHEQRNLWQTQRLGNQRHTRAASSYLSHQAIY